MSEENRFAFGENWKAFLAALDEERIVQAVTSLQEILSVETLAEQRFLDIGSGSGLFSLAAHRLGAEVVSIDYDADSVGCTNYLKEKFSQSSPPWHVQQGSVLDSSLMESLGEFDIVYSWGVLHHTGDMQRAIELVSLRTKASGKLCIAIYNDQGAASRRWLQIKKIYHRFPPPLRPVWVVLIAGMYEAKFALSRARRWKNPLPFSDWRAKKKDRGMSAWHDWVDWVGGLPFEVATPQLVIELLGKRGFSQEKQKTVGKGWGCNEYVFRKQET